jgi:hypothetical protein
MHAVFEPEGGSMKRSLRAGVVVGLWLIAATAQAQGDAHWYVFGTTGQVRVEEFSATTFQAGGGGEYLVGGLVGVGAELGYLAPTRAWGEGIGVFSTNGSVHFRRSGRLVPYATAGYTLLFDDLDDTLNCFNVGGGVNYWFARRAGLRLELRDQIHVADRATVHWWGFRFGITFR